MRSFESTSSSAIATSSAGSWPRAAAEAIEATRRHVLLAAVFGRQVTMHESAHFLERNADTNSTLSRVFREQQGVVGRIDNSDKCGAALLATKSIAFTPGRVESGSFAAAEI
jgi:hypothetical protein